MTRISTSVFRVLSSFWKTSIAIELEYRLNLLVELLSVIGNLIGSLFTLSLFFGPEQDLGGWNWSSSLIVIGIYTLLDGFTITFLQPNLSRIVRHVQNGTLDFILLKPFDSQLWLSLRIFSPWGLPSIILGFVLILFGVIKTGSIITLAVLLVSFLMLISSLLILYSLWFLIATTSIWFVRVWNANEVLRSTLAAGRYPISAYPDSLRRVFTFVLPIAFLTTVPAEALLNIITVKTVTLSIFISTICLYFSRRFWTFALRYYTSASS